MQQAMRPLAVLVLAAIAHAGCQPLPSPEPMARPVGAAASGSAASGNASAPSGPPRIVLQVGLPDGPSDFAIGADGALLAASTGPTGTGEGAFCSTTVWDVRTGAVRGVLDACGDLEFSPDGGSLRSRVTLWGPGGVAQLSEDSDKEPTAWHGFSPKGEWAACSHGSTVRVFNTKMAKRQATIALSGAVRSVAFGSTRQGALVAVADASQPAISVWDLGTGTRKADVAGHASAPIALRFTGDGSLLVSVSEDGAVRTWDVQSGKSAQSPSPAKSPVRGVVFSPDASHFALVGDSSPEAAVQIGSVRPLRIGGPVRIPRSKTARMLFSPDGNALLFAGTEGDLGIWSVPESLVVGHLPAAGRVESLAWAQGGSVVEAHVGGQIVRWDRASSKALPALPLPAGKTTTVGWDPTGRYRLNAGPGIAEVWDVAGGSLLGSVDLVSGPSMVAFTGPADPLGARIAWPVHNNLAIWDATTGQVQSSPVGTQPGKLLHTSWSADGSTLAAVGPGGYVTAVRAGSNVGLQGPKPPQFAYSVEASLSSDGRLMLLPDAGALRVHATEKAAHLTTLPNASSGVFSPDAKWIAVSDANGQGLGVWDVERGKYAWSKERAGFTADQPFSASGTWVLLTPRDIEEPCKVHVVRASSGTRKEELRGCSFMPIGDDAWSPKGDVLAHATACGVALWDGRGQRNLLAIESSDGWPETPVSVAWSPDGTRLATSFGLFDVQSGARIPLAPRDGRLPKGVSWSQDGTSVIGTFDFAAVLYDASSGAVQRTWEGIERASFLQGGKVVLVRELDQHHPLDLWRRADGARLRIAMLSIPGEGIGWVAHTEDGHFDASPNALHLIRFRMGNDLAASPLVDPGAAGKGLRVPGLVAAFLSPNTPQR